MAIENEFRDEIIEDDSQNQQSTKQLGNNLENFVEKILIYEGYKTKKRHPMKGKSGAFNEIDVYGTNGKTEVAVECKNYAEDNKVGIPQLRDFTSKLADLDIQKGIFVTSSDFSSEARKWAKENPQGKQILLWNGKKLSEKIPQVILGRSSSKKVKVPNCLPLQNNIEHYSQLRLKNKGNVLIERQELSFNPYYILGFSLKEKIKLPNKQIIPRQISGQYIIDASTRSFIHQQDDNQVVQYELDDERRHIVQDLLNKGQRKNIDILQGPNSKIHVNDPSMTIKDAEFEVRNKITKDYQAKIPYKVGKSEDGEDTMEYTHYPDDGSIRLQTKLVYVPRIEIDFSSKQYKYVRVYLPASDTPLIDQISICKHSWLGDRHTFAVCETCGIAKCEQETHPDKQGKYYCEDHTPE